MAPAARCISRDSQAACRRAAPLALPKRPAGFLSGTGTQNVRALLRHGARHSVAAAWMALLLANTIA
jgi:hypothetical protein